MSKIYIETEMTELPKGCRWCVKGGIIVACKAMSFCENRGIDTVRNPFEPQRHIKCPLKQGMLVDDDELSIGGTGEND